MKKVTLLLLSALLVLLLGACGNDEPDLMEPVNFYYCSDEITYNSPTGVICPEVRESADYHGNLRSILDAYLEGPVSAGLVSPVPSGTRIVELELIEDEALLTFSSELSSLSGIKLTTACSCIALTVSELVPVSNVCFRVMDGQLDNKDEVVVNTADIVLMDDVN